MEAFFTYFKSSKLLQIALIIVTCTVIYLPILQNAFVFDDEEIILAWKTPKSFQNMGKFLEGEAPPRHEGTFRPARIFTFAVDYKLWGENPVGYHIQALLMNAICAALVYLIVATITRKSLTAFVTALLFSIHPMHTEGVTFMTASVDVMGLMYGFAAFYFYITTKRERSVRHWLSLIFTFLAIFTYEITLILPVLMVVYDFLFLYEGDIKKWSLKSLRSSMYHWAFIGYYVLLRILLSFKSKAISTPYWAGSFGLTMLLSSKFFVYYFTLLAFPLNLSLYHEVAHGINTFGISHGALADLPFLDIYNISAIIIFFVSFFVVSKTYRSRPLIAFAILWFYICMAPVAGFFPIHAIFGERYTFFASFGFCLLIGTLITAAPPKNSKFSKLAPHIQTAFFFLLIFMYIGGTVTRNNDWRDGVTLWSEVTRSAPNAAVGWSNLGLEYHKRGLKDQEFEAYKKGIQVEPGFGGTHNNIANVYMQRGNYEKAVEEFRLALKYEPGNQVFAFNLKSAMKTRDDYALSPKEQEARKKAEPVLFKAREELSKGNIQQALELIETEIKKNSTNADFYNDAGVIYMSQQNYPKSIEYLLKAEKLAPEEPDIYLNLANAYLANGDNEKAKKSLQSALELKPDFDAARDLLRSIK